MIFFYYYIIIPLRGCISEIIVKLILQEALMKSEIRKSLIQKRMDQKDEEIKHKSHQIFERLINEKILTKHHRILLYKDFRKEVQTDELIDYLLEQGHEVALPRVSEDFKTMTLYLITGDDDLQISSYGILEPIPCKEREIEASSLDLVLSPGVGFTPDCYRIGYGGGFYDKMLSNLSNIFVCGLAFDCQIVNQLPLEEHDQQLDMILTESHTYIKYEV